MWKSTGLDNCLKGESDFAKTCMRNAFLLFPSVLRLVWDSSSPFCLIGCRFHIHLAAGLLPSALGDKVVKAL